MPHRIIIINGPNINLLGEREKSQYGKLTFEELKNKCLSRSSDLKVEIEKLTQNGVNLIDSNKDFAILDTRKEGNIVTRLIQS